MDSVINGTLIGKKEITDILEKNLEIKYYRTEEEFSEKENRLIDEKIYGVRLQKYDLGRDIPELLEEYWENITDSKERIDFIIDKLINNSVTVTGAPEVIDCIYDMYELELGCYL